MAPKQRVGSELLVRRVRVDDYGSAVIALPFEFAQLEGLHPGREVGMAFDQGLLDVASPDQANLVYSLLRMLRKAGRKVA
jgi:hypothetical protein